MILKQFCALPERERTLFLFGFLFDEEFCSDVLEDDIRHSALYSQLARTFKTYSPELKQISVLSLWLSADS